MALTLAVGVAHACNIGVGMTAGLLSYPLLKLIAGRAREVTLPMWLLAALSLLFYAVYPYHHG